MTISIHVKEPCHENWDEMLEVQSGKHCLACSKTVMDFTNFTDDQLLNYFKNSKNKNTCGRFADQQLNKELIPLPQRRHQWASKFFAGTTLIFTGFFNHVSGAINSKQKTKIEQLNPKITELTKQQNGGISGRVLDENGLPINEALVYCKNNNTTVKTDTNGLFLLNFVPLLENTIIDLEITKVNCTSVNYQSAYKDLPEQIEVNLTINQNLSITKGEISMIEDTLNITNDTFYSDTIRISAHPYKLFNPIIKTNREDVKLRCSHFVGLLVVKKTPYRNKLVRKFKKLFKRKTHYSNR